MRGTHIVCSRPLHPDCVFAFFQLSAAFRGDQRDPELEWQRSSNHDNLRPLWKVRIPSAMVR
jgi:hypothetical protein